MKHVIIAGTFEIGERIRAAQLHAVEQARTLSGEHVLLVNDIGVAQKLLAFERGGAVAVNGLYADRLACARTGCQISQLPKNDVEAEQFRDDDALRTMLKVLRAYTASFNLAEVQRVCQQVIVPTQIEARCRTYGLDVRAVHILSERVLRNTIARSLRRRLITSSHSLVSVIQEAQRHHQGLALLLEELKSPHNIPTCRAIMLQCYMTLAQSGYTHVTLIQEPLHQLAFENAAELYRHLHDAFPDDARFQLRIEYMSIARLIVK